ncbi:FG-GAP-like repeat-containing protein [Streptomyces jumonjinensis]|uniref:FG-GAP-like repeat-containing protein n=1 Tax=Streptomyces jumonjinensis TaxID=1945 RepID=UPI003794D9DF
MNPTTTPRRPVGTVALAAAVVMAAAGLVPLTLAASPAYAAAPEKAVQDDFNGDGYRDLVVSASYADVKGKYGAGAVVVLYGSKTGVKADKRKVLTQDSPGVPGTAEEYDAFGAAMTSADLDRDGYTDLLVASDRESVGTREGRGSVVVIWGGKSGLTASGATLPAPDFSEWAGFGQNLTAGDHDGDGDVDVSVAARDGATHYKGPFTRKGAPADYEVDPQMGTVRNVISGDLSGDGVPERIILNGSTDGDANGIVFVDRWSYGKQIRTELPKADGLVGAVADFDKDGYGDLVLGAPLEPEHGSPGSLGGRISVWRGGPFGPSLDQKPLVLHQDSPGVPGTAEEWDTFGYELSVGDTDGDGYPDVAVSAQGEDVSGAADAGTVTVLRGGSNGLTTDGARSFSQNTAGVPGAAEKDDNFGTPRLLDVNGNGRAELAVGAMRENEYGGLTVLGDSAAGVTAKSAVSMTARTVGLTGVAWFGRAFAH